MNVLRGTGKPIYYRWWFWVAFILLIAGTFYLKSYFDWRGDYDLAHTDDYALGLAAQLFKYQANRLEEQYKNDTYGGDTPEETLRLFVAALEEQDYALAAKYYVPEEQKRGFSDLMKAHDSGAVADLVGAYRAGSASVPSIMGTTGVSEIEVTPKGENVGYNIRFIQNSFTKRWKILEL